MITIKSAKVYDEARAEELGAVVAHADADRGEREVELVFCDGNHDYDNGGFDYGASFALASDQARAFAAEIIAAADAAER